MEICYTFFSECENVSFCLVRLCRDLSHQETAFGKGSGKATEAILLGKFFGSNPEVICLRLVDPIKADKSNVFCGFVAIHLLTVFWSVPPFIPGFPSQIRQQ